MAAGSRQSSPRPLGLPDALPLTSKVAWHLGLLAAFTMLHRGQGSSSRLLWLGVGWMLTDCVASIKLVDPIDLPEGGGSTEPSSGRQQRAGSVLAILVDKASLRFFKYQRGELVVIKSPEEPRRRLVRRLAGVEGDFVSVAGGKTERLPKGSCWVESDSGLRAAGGDSRVAWGPVPLALVEGRVSHVLWPPARWGSLSPRPCPSGTRVVGKGGSLEFLHPPTEDEDWWS